MKKPQDISSNFDLRHLEIFCKVYELRSFSKAAEAVFLAQASVSERIANLENMMGAKLFDRLGRKIIPTKAGEFFYKKAMPLLNMKNNICMEFQEFLGVKRGEIHAGGSTIPGEYILPGLIQRFRKTYPFISVSITIADSKKIEQNVLEGNLDLGIVGAITSGKNLERYNLWEDELVLAVPAGHSWTKERKVSLHKLMEEPFVTRQRGSGTLKVMAKCMNMSDSQITKSFKIVARLGSSTAVKEAIKAGLGVSVLSSRAIDTELKAGLIKIIRIDGISMKRHFYLIRDRRRTSSPPCRALLDFLVSTHHNEQQDR